MTDPKRCPRCGSEKIRIWHFRMVGRTDTLACTECGFMCEVPSSHHVVSVNKAKPVLHLK